MSLKDIQKEDNKGGYIYNNFEKNALFALLEEAIANIAPAEEQEEESEADLENPTEFQNHETPPNILTKVNISLKGFDQNKVNVIVYRIKNKLQTNIIDSKEANQTAKELLNINYDLFKSDQEVGDILIKMKEMGLIYLNPMDGYFYFKEGEDVIR
jgi:hypothetical protein